MSSASQPTFYVIAGPNGAGKTTFALRYLPEMTGCRNFINADLIADGLSPLNPAGVQIEAGKIFLREIEANVAAGTDFAFETTLSGRMYIRLLKELRSTRLRSDGTTARQEGWKVVLFYLWIPGAEFSRLRVRQRVESGGHNIPDEAITRRYRRTVSNFLTVFAPLCDEVFCYDNSDLGTVPVFSIVGGEKEVLDADRYRLVLESGNE
jgi:predicted ABC-type ATPase